MATRRDIVLCGVGGQGVLSLSSIIGLAGIREGLEVKQSEVHGMAQRGGGVMAHLRISDDPIASDLIARGSADLIIAMEPLESLRHLPYLASTGTLITATEPIVNLTDYPPIEELLDQIRRLPAAILVDAERLAREAGSVRASNMVLVGAAAPFLPVSIGTMEACIAEVFRRKGEKIVDANTRAFHLGRASSHTQTP